MGFTGVYFSWTCFPDVFSLDIQPNPEVLEHCAAFLLNVKDWTYLSNMQNTDSGHIEVRKDE